VIRSWSRNHVFLLQDPPTEPNQAGAQKTDTKGQSQGEEVESDVRIWWGTLGVNLTKLKSSITRLNDAAGYEMHQF
jgi:hypothetical protein